MIEQASIPTRETVKGRAEGRRRRAELPRKDLATLGDRHLDFDPIATLVEQGRGRVESLLPLRAERMAVDEFSFLRGAAAIMAYDLAMTPSTQIDVQLCGDAHISNFGVFSSPERRLTFGLNDFDETLPGPFDWDVKRMAASAAVALRSQGRDESTIAKALRKAIAVYRTTILDLAARGNMAVWYTKLDIEANIDQLRSAFTDEHGSRVDNLVAQARRKDSHHAYGKLVGMVGSKLGFLADPPLIVPMQDLLAQGESGSTTEAILDVVFDGYLASIGEAPRHLLETFERVDIARKVVGVGSVGTRCFVVLLLGRDLDDPLILQIKEAVPSVLEAHLGPDHHTTHGDRVIAGQRLLQSTPDLFLGAFRAQYSATETHDFYVRQFHDGKAAADLSSINSTKIFTRYVGVCAWVLARAHARSGNRAAIAAYLGQSTTFEEAITDWAIAYGERNASDYAAFIGGGAAGSPA